MAPCGIYSELSLPISAIAYDYCLLQPPSPLPRRAPERKEVSKFGSSSLEVQHEVWITPNLSTPLLAFFSASRSHPSSLPRPAPLPQPPCSTSRGCLAAPRRSSLAARSTPPTALASSRRTRSTLTARSGRATSSTPCSTLMSSFPSLCLWQQERRQERWVGATW